MKIWPVNTLEKGKHMLGNIKEVIIKRENITNRSHCGLYRSDIAWDFRQWLWYFLEVWHVNTLQKTRQYIVKD